MLLAKLPFVIHALMETAAALSFIFKPESQLPNPSVAAQLVAKNLGGLLLSTNMMCLIFITRPFDQTSRLVAASLAFWHLWPCNRAYVRLTQPAVDGKTDGQSKTLGGPAVHLGSHLCLFLAFAGVATL
ncbi:hypothetical protein Cob_v001978 [Colletotrichum orbiculare MAFF 240422]|uniref:Uncharacterized protein n=1 Tax=Colletotrichum orbiculare (strain 104-T / ATCC 96160 / CBS 514.97 / LARS 414 / MAFF 240422) TaxID=1213857 RepID=N4V9N3_COLOR|nr:hypothetical protein Cob_v001978 [Colletotrichum orbiculare MAFF 240422]